MKQTSHARRRLSEADLKIHFGDPFNRSGRELIGKCWVHSEAASYSSRGTDSTLTLAFPCNKLILGRTTLAFNEASRVAQWWPNRVDSYVVRVIRGSNKMSLHSWALAFDVFGRTGPEDPKTGLHRPPQAWINAMKLMGFEWGGSFKSNYDPHHFEWPYLPPMP